MELMVTILVFSILLVIGVPSFRTMILNNRMTSEANEFMTSLLLARSEAVRRNVDVYVCATTDGQNCGGSGTPWGKGWLVFADVVHGSGQKGVVNAGTGACAATEDCVLEVDPAIPGSSSSLTGSTAVASAIAYTPTGAALQADGTPLTTAVSFTLCDSRGAADAKAVVVSTTGRPRISSTNDDGSALTCP